MCISYKKRNPEGSHLQETLSVWQTSDPAREQAGEVTCDPHDNATLAIATCAWLGVFLHDLDKNKEERLVSNSNILM